MDSSDGDYEDDSMDAEPMVMDSQIHEEPSTTDETDYPFLVLTPNDIVKHMTDCINEANTVIQLPSTTMRVLLQQVEWDKEKLFEKYFGENQEELFKSAQIVNPNEISESEGAKVEQKTNTENNDCEICCEECPPEMMFGLSCGHQFCKSCWSDYLETKIMKEGMGTSIECQASECKVLLDDATVMSLISDEEVRLRYQRLISNNFVQCNRRIKWCPNKGCLNAIKVEWIDGKDVTCKCGHRFCFECCREAHNPIKCSWLTNWFKRFDSGGENELWILANTKKCPKCNSDIEKNGGCNYIKCKSCKHAFCWICLEPWNHGGGHDWYKCNRFNEAEALARRTDQEESRAALERYWHYWTRYSNHMNSLKYGYNLYETIRGKMKALEKQGMTWIEVQFLRKAVDILCQSRQTLMNTYVFAFFVEIVDDNNQLDLFERNHADLEKATEELSEFLEREITEESRATIKQQVQAKYDYCESRRKVLITHVYEGFEKNWWVYKENP